MKLVRALGVWGPLGVFEGVAGGPEQKGDQFIFTTMTDLRNTMAKCMAILVMGFKHFLQ